MFATAQELGIGVMAYGPMAHGLLTGAMGRNTSFAQSKDGPKDWRASGFIFGQSLFAPEYLPQNLEVVESLKAVATRLDTTLPRLALAWVLRQPAISVALSGAAPPPRSRTTSTPSRSHSPPTCSPRSIRSSRAPPARWIACPASITSPASLAAQTPSPAPSKPACPSSQT